ncbi:MAG: glycosyltransferase [Phycisphaerales bacterium]|nr:glycosyltransferase [Phycisphaerales bacterium]
MRTRTTAFLSTFPPRLCGIATFTSDLSRAVARANPSVGTAILAMTDPAAPQTYPECVRCEIRRGVKGDYASAAAFVNYSNIQLVSIQHEYGIFGGDDGVHILDFLSRIRVPAIATLHTVLKSPSNMQRGIVEEIARRCGRLVVMSQLGARLLTQSYDVPADKVAVIPHGIPDLPRDDTEGHKEHVGAAGRRLLLTFGLLSPNKGVETVIRALPRLVERFPNLLYFVVGATHPEIKRRQGEEYRHALEREAHALGVAEHVVFRNQFVSLEELCGYLQAADIYIASYRNEAQITSGALAYAMGAGAAVVCTPFWHAQELLAEGRGRLFPFDDSIALAQTVDALLSNDSDLRSLREAAYDYTRSMIWSRVGEAYATLGEQVLRDTALPSLNHLDSVAMRDSSLPEPCLDHLLRLTDDTGIIQHATFSIPARRTGYCVDDNARALLVALLAHRVTGSPAAKRLIPVYLGFLHYCQREDGGFHNFVDYNRVVESEVGSQDCIGRALWALGAAVLMAPDDGARRLAHEMFDRGVTPVPGFGPRGQALAIMGLDAILRVEPENGHVRTMLDSLADKLCQRYQQEADDDWKWFEPKLTYDNAIIPLALFTTFRVSGKHEHLEVATESLGFLDEVCFAGEHLTLVGNRGWHSRSGSEQAPEADEQPIDAAAFVLAFGGAYLATGERRYLRRMHQSFDWFLGANRLGIRLYDFSTGGCRDGLGTHEASQNQGAESTVSYLMALLTMLDIGGPGGLDPEGAGEAAESARLESIENQNGSVEVRRRRRANASAHG